MTTSEIACSTLADSQAERPVVSVRDLIKHYAATGDTVRALDGVSLSVAKGEFVSIMGASGSGKSTLLYLLAGLDHPTSGTVTIDGRDLGALSDKARTLFRRDKLGVIFQAYNLLPTLSAVENVALPAMLAGGDEANDRRRACELLERVHLTHRADHRPTTLSGGEQQRVAIARALMNDPSVILADEPTGNLDTRQSGEIWKLLRSLASDQGCTIVAVTHEASGAALADRVIVLKDGVVVGELQPRGDGDAKSVAARYSELVG